MQKHKKEIILAGGAIIAAIITACGYIASGHSKSAPVTPTTAPVAPTSATVISTPTPITPATAPTAKMETVTGTVKGTNGRPISGAKVVLLDSTKGLPPLAYTDSEGIFTFPWKGGNVHIEIEAHGYEPQDRRLNPDKNSEIEEFRLPPS